LGRPERPARRRLPDRLREAPTAGADAGHHPQGVPGDAAGLRASLPPLPAGPAAVRLPPRRTPRPRLGRGLPRRRRVDPAGAQDADPPEAPAPPHHPPGEPFLKLLRWLARVPRPLQDHVFLNSDGNPWTRTA